MKRIVLFFYIFVLHTCLQSFSQTDKFKGEAFLFKEATTNQAIVIEYDSVFFKKNPEKKFQLKHTPYPEIISRYNAFYIYGKNYFAHNGCGPVLEWRNDSLVRIDNSFLHQNQYGAASFVYQNEIYYFGGYGLFTFKNILTKYIFKSKEWMAIQTFGDEFPSLRRDANRILIGDNLYIFGGLSENPESFYFGQIPSDTILWKLDLKTKKWTKEGVFNAKYNSAEGYFNFQVGNKMYLISRGADNKIVEIDLINNSAKKYILPSLILPKSIYYDETKKEIVLLHFLSTNASSKIVRLKLSSVLVNPIEDEQFASNPLSKWFTATAFLAALLFLTFILYKTRIKRKIQEYKTIFYNTKTQQLIFKGNPIDSFDSNELKIIFHLITNQKDYIPLNSLNNLFEQEELTENYTTTTKRRENSLHNIITKLSLITGYNENEIIIYRKNPDDKKMKEIKLKANFIRLK